MGRSIVIIGAGPAGVEAAVAARNAGANVTIISEGPIGGRAGWHSLVPSKVWLSAAAKVNDVSAPIVYDAIPDLTPHAVVQRIQQTKQAWHHEQSAALEREGVQIIHGMAAFTDPQTLAVRDQKHEFLTEVGGDAFIVASGSVPIFPPNLKPDGDRVIAPRFASHLNELPRSIIIVGAGATGCESAYFFNRYGVEVTWIVDQFGILPRMNPDLGRSLGDALAHQGVQVVEGQMVDRLERDVGVTAVLSDGKRYQADMAFVAIGRKPDWERINFSAAQVTPDSAGTIHVDQYGRIGSSKIYLVGDAAGGAMVANKAMAQARVAGRHAAGIPVLAADPQLVVQVTYTEPQVAQLGQAQIVKGVDSVRIPFSTTLKAHLLERNEGFVEIFYSTTDRRLRGAMAIGPHAADVLTPLVVALHLKANVDQLAEIYAPHPTLTELPFIAARAAR